MAETSWALQLFEEPVALDDSISAVEMLVALQLRP